MQDQLTLPESTRRDLAVERSQKVSRALHDAARKARATVRGTTVWKPGFSRTKRGGRGFTIVSLLAISIVPTLLFTIYISLFASDQYQVEAKFAIKGKAMMLSDALGALTGMPSLQQAQDSQVIIDYVESRTLVEKLDRELNLRDMFGRAGIDVLSRINRNEPMEQLVKYWRKQIRMKVEMPANIVYLTIRAFTPEDSLRIGNAIVAASEQLVNDLSDRSRRDAVETARIELERAEAQLVQMRAQSKATRDQEGLIDPKRSGDEFLKIMGELKLDKIKLDAEIQVASRNLSPQSPGMQTLRAKVDAVSTQIANVERSLTTKGKEASLSDSYVRFDKSRLDQEWAEKHYQMVAGSLEKARVDSERQQVYLESFIQPVLPQEAEFPRRIWLICMVGACSFLAWFILTWVRSLVYG